MKTSAKVSANLSLCLLSRFGTTSGLFIVLVALCFSCFFAGVQVWSQSASQPSSPSSPSLGASNALNAAKMLYADQRYDDAAQTLLAITKRDSSNAAVYRLLGEVYAASGDEERAVASLERSLQLDSTNFFAVITLARIYRDRQQYDAARELYLRAYRAGAGDESLALGIANTYYEQQRYSLALEWYGRIGKPTANVYWQKARCFAELGLDVRAGDAYTSAVTLAPTNTGLLLERVDYWLKQGQSDEPAYNIAEEYARQASDRFPRDTRFYVRRAEALLQLRRPDAAYNTLAVCIILGDSVGERWRDMGIASYMRKQYRVADSLFAIAQAKFEAKHELDSRLLYFCGLTKREIGEYGEATGYFKMAMMATGKAKQIADMHTQIGLSQRKAGHTETARSHYAHAIGTAPDRAEAYYEMATLLDDANLKFSSEAAQKQHRELVVPLYFKFLERSMTKKLKTVEFAEMRLILLGVQRSEIDAHCGWLRMSGGKESEPSTLKTVPTEQSSQQITSATLSTSGTTAVPFADSSSGGEQPDRLFNKSDTTRKSKR